MKKMLGMSLIAIALIGMAGCKQKNEVGTDEIKKNVSISTSTKKEKAEETSSSIEKEQKDSEKIDWNAAQQALKENSEAEKVTTIYEDSTPIKNGNDQGIVTINGYQYVQIEDFSRDFRIPFGDQTKEGGVLLVSATVKNSTSQNMYVGPGFSMNVVGYDSSIGRNKNLLEEDLVSEFVEKKNEIKANEELSGYVALAIKPEAMEKIKESGTGEFEVPGLYSKSDSYSKADALVEPKKETIPLSDDGSLKKEASSKFYEDKATKENMGTKTMLVEKELNKTETFEDMHVTAIGYQITTFEPNKDQAARFSKFDSGVVLITVKLDIKNQGKESLSSDQTSGTLTIGNKIKLMSENMLQVDTGTDNVGKGNEATKYLVFAIDKESYDKLYKDQDYLLDVSLYDTEFKRLTTIGDLSFEFSNK